MIRLRRLDLGTSSLSFSLSSLPKRAAGKRIAAIRSIPITHRQQRCHHVVVAVSGGVDSSVAAALLKEELVPLTSSNSSNGINPQSTINSLSAIHMSNWCTYDDDSLPQVCPNSQVDWKDATAICHTLSIELEHKHFSRDYWNDVFEPYLTDITTKGHIGNPDFGCNTHIKFGVLRDYCLQKYGPNSFLATGHYARLWHRRSTSPIVSMCGGATSSSSVAAMMRRPACVEQAMQQDETGTREWISTWGGSEPRSGSRLPSILLAAADRSKDQSYFLAGCSGNALTNVLFPLGDLYKKMTTTTTAVDPQAHNNQRTVRQLAEDFHLPTASKRESMGICFVGKRPNGFRDFIQHYLPPAASPVDFVDIDTGQTVGTTAPERAHAFLFVPGQGAKLSGTPQKYFIVGNSVFDDNNMSSRRDHRDHPIVWVCAGTHHPALYADSLLVDESSLNWMAAGECPPPLWTNSNSNCVEWRTQCRIRHLQPLMDCTVRRSSSADNGPFLEVLFDKPVRGIAPGQQIVFYGLDGLVCFGGGPVAQRGPTFWERGRTLPQEVNSSGHNDRSVVRTTQRLPNTRDQTFSCSYSRASPL